MRTTCSTHVIPFDFIIVVIYVEEYNLWSSSICSFIQPTYHVVPNILFSTLSQIAPVYAFPLLLEPKPQTHTKLQAKSQFRGL
jgi:hypothetical protein